MERLNREYNLNINDKIAIKYGTANKVNPRVVYVSGKCWISPKIASNHKEYLIGLENTIRKSINTNLLNCHSFDGKYILDYDVSLENFKVGVKKFLSFDIYLRQNGDKVKQVKELIPIVSDKMIKVSNELVSNLENNGFSVTKKKK